MGLIRLIIFGLVIWMIWRLVKNFQASQRRKENTKAEIEQSNMVLCKYCAVHVPEKDAVSNQQLWFCSNEHKNKYLAGDQQQD